MDPRRASRRPAPRAPYAAGEDLATPTMSATPRAPRRTRQEAADEPPRAGYRVGEEALAGAPARRRRGAAPARLAGRAIRAAGRRLRRVSPMRALALAAPLVAVLALLLWLSFGSYWQVRHVRVQGTDDATLLALARAQRLTGCDAFRCEFSAAQRAIAASPRAQAVSVSVVFPDTALVSITPRLPVALWTAQGQTWAVGADGVVVGSTQRDPSLARADAARVDDPAELAFAGHTPQPGSRMNPALVAMASQLRISASAVGLQLSALRYSAQDGFTARAPDGALIIFGSPDDAQATLADVTGAAPAVASTSNPSPASVARGARIQMEAASAILKRLAQTGASASVIDVRWGAHPYYR